MEFTGDALTDLIPAKDKDITDCQGVSENELEYILLNACERIVYLFDYLKYLPVYNRLLDHPAVVA